MIKIIVISIDELYRLKTEQINFEQGILLDCDETVVQLTLTLLKNL